jgi:hypothetical protein
MFVKKIVPGCLIILMLYNALNIFLQDHKEMKKLYHLVMLSLRKILKNQPIKYFF